MKVLLAVTVLLALHCTFSQGSLVESLKELLEKAEKREEHIQEKKREQEEEAVLEKLVDKLRAKKGLGDWFNNLADDAGEFFGNAGDVLGNLGESATDVLNIDSSEAEDIELPDDLITSGSRNPCKKPVFLQESSSGAIDFPGDGGDYPRLENCKWVVNASSSNKKIKIEFTFMDINTRGDCDDYVEIYALECKATNDNEHRGIDLTNKLCAEGLENMNQKSKSFTIPSSCAYIHFRSNFWYRGKGFKLNYSFVN